MTTRPEEERSYEEILRAVGAYLDGVAHARFSLIELPNGFTLVLEPASEKQKAAEVHFPRVGLEAQIKQLIRNRKRLGGKYQGKWHLAPTSHQDFLRALGFELDDSDAKEILIDELEDGLLVTYSYLDPSQGYQWRKHSTTLRRAEIETILQAAHNRRVRRGLLRL